MLASPAHEDWEQAAAALDNLALDSQSSGAAPPADEAPAAGEG